MNGSITVRGGASLAITDEGRGPAVVLMHGWPVTTYHWRHTAPALVDAGMRAIRVELRGLGGGSTGPGPFDKETLAAEVADLMDRSHVREFAVVGHDWGGTIGFLLAADLGGRVRALVIEEELLPGTSVTIPEPGRLHYPTWHGPFNRAPGLAEVLVPDREDAYYGTFLRQSAGPVPLDEDAERAYVMAYRASSCLSATLGYYRTSDADARAVALRSRTPIDVPVLTVGGGFGMGMAVAECFAAVARTVTHQQVDEAGHYPAEQRPEVANASIVSFVRQHLAGRSASA